MSKNYVIDHDMYLMNHSNGDVLKVTVSGQDHAVKSLRLYRQDGYGNYYFDRHAQMKNREHLATKKDVVRASKEIGAHNTRHAEKWHHEVVPIYNAQHQVMDFKPRLVLKHHKKIQNAKRYLRHLNHHHAAFLFQNSSRSWLMIPLNTLRDWIYEDRNREMVLAHKVHKLAR